MDRKLKICLFTATYNRFELTDYVLSYYKNIKDKLKDVCDLHLICVGSDGEKGKIIAEKNGFEYLEHPNEPLTQKHNYGIMMCKKYNPDGVIHVGSDDIMGVEFFKHHIECLKNGIDFCGILDIYFLTKDKLGYWNGYKPDSSRYLEPVGPGKLYSKRLMDLLNWKPWGDVKLNKSLDRVVNNNLKKLKFTSKVIKCEDVGALLIDIKTNVNITDINDFVYDKEFGIDYINSLNIDYNKIKGILITKKN
jgi:hypothetical protein